MRFQQRQEFMPLPATVYGLNAVPPNLIPGSSQGKGIFTGALRITTFADSTVRGNQIHPERPLCF